MKRKTFMTIVAGLLILSGCGGELKGHPRAELKVAETAYIGIVETLTDLNNAGQIAPDERAVITELVHTGRDLLRQWHEAVLATDRRPDVADQALYIIRRLAEWQLQKEKGDS